MSKGHYPAWVPRDASELPSKPLPTLEETEAFTQRFHRGEAPPPKGVPTTGGLIAVLVVGAILGTLLGIFIKRKIWIMVALLGMVAGFFSGTLIFALIASASGWTAAWGWWVISIIMAIVGTLLAYGLGKPVVLMATSFVGSYLFVRAWTLFFPGHWPSEAQLMSDYSSVETDSIFWVFVTLLIISIIGSICFQTKRGKVHKDLDDAFQRVE